MVMDSEGVCVGHTQLVARLRPCDQDLETSEERRQG